MALFALSHGWFDCLFCLSTYGILVEIKLNEQIFFVQARDLLIDLVLVLLFLVCVLLSIAFMMPSNRCSKRTLSSRFVVLPWWCFWGIFSFCFVLCYPIIFGFLEEVFIHLFFVCWGSEEEGGWSWLQVYMILALKSTAICFWLPSDLD